MAKYKYGIPNLKKKIPLCEGVKITLKYKYKRIKFRLDNFLENDSVENLHNLRIDLRRFRYTLENFDICFKTSLFFKALEELKHLQDVIGEGRDLDILEAKLRALKENNSVELSEETKKVLFGNKDVLRKNIRNELINFRNNNKIKILLKKSREEQK